jgi:PAS domain S-box-containing protein
MTRGNGYDREPADALRARLADAEDMLRAIRQGEVDALVVDGLDGGQIYTLHSAEEPYRNLIEQMQEGAVVLTPGGDILYANARFAALVGEPLQSVTGTPFGRFVHPSDQDDVETMLETGSGRRRCRLLGPDRTPCEVSLSLTTSAARADRRNLIVTDMTEILDIQSKRDKAEHESRTREAFLAMVAHEIRNPIGAISNAAQVLKITHGEGQPASHARGVIARQVEHIARLIDDLLDTERVISGKIRLNLSRLDLAEAARQAVATLAADPRIDRRFEINIASVWIDGDAMRIGQVLTNLLANAVKFTPPGGRIRVALLADGADAVLTVEDWGCGISSSALPFIFDMYTQADSRADRAPAGLGIGLALVRHFVGLHGGSVAASSEGEGRGTTFTVRLRKSQTAAIQAGALLSGERRAHPRRVILIEDNGEAREILHRMLELAGHVVYDAPDVARGLELLDAVRPHVGIIDVGPNGREGYQAAQRIRESPQGQNMLLLALNDRGSPLDRHQLLKHGFDYHLVNPVDPDYLARLIGQN